MGSTINRQNVGGTAGPPRLHVPALVKQVCLCNLSMSQVVIVLYNSEFEDDTVGDKLGDQGMSDDKPNMNGQVGGPYWASSAWERARGIFLRKQPRDQGQQHGVDTGEGITGTVHHKQGPGTLVLGYLLRVMEWMGDEAKWKDLMWQCLAIV
ncbi:hypothetical protein B0H10DRAFT_1959406 [Mycena sp. CBHHK59/15]|nr:hypothetical protein B0H10DRAFT_1959406 [Mycena sp. CBHHK59/15]